MSDKSILLDDAADSAESAFARLLRKLPGLGSYADKNARRHADAQLRQAVADQLRTARVQLGDVQRTLSVEIVRAMAFAEPFGRCDTQLIGLIGKIEAAPTGYAGWFDQTVVDETALDTVYAFDEQFLKHAEKITMAAAELADGVKLDDAITTSLAKLDGLVQQAQAEFDKRVELLAQFSR